MKTSFALAATAATLALARPQFLNSNFNVVAGEPFTLTFSGCDEGCEIILQNGPSDNLKDVQTLIPKTTGSSETITLSPKFPDDTYAFKIVAEGEAPNYSPQFEIEGTTPVTTTSTEAETTSTPAETSTATSSEAETTTTEETTTAETTTAESTSTEASTTTMITVHSSTHTPEASTTSHSASTTTDGAAPTEVPGAAVRLGSSNVALLAGVAAVAGYFL